MSERLSSIEYATETVLTCRDEGHLWAHVNDEIVYGQRTNQVLNYTQVRQCARCACIRRRRITVPTFRVEYTSYVYPDGYLLEKGVYADAKRAVRNARLNTLLAGRASS